MAEAGAHSPLRLHATAVSRNGRALVFTGASGSGKSSLALELMARGATLVGDDQLLFEREGDELIVRPEPRLSGMIEARGIGLLRADTVGSSVVAAFVDLDTDETERLPPHRTTTLLGVTLPEIRRSASPLFAAALAQYLLKGRKE